MFTILLTARSCPTILPKSRRSKSRTSELLISGSRSTSSEKYGLTIAMHLVPAFPGLPSTPNFATHLPIATPYSIVLIGGSSFSGGIAVLLGCYRQLELRALAAGLDFFDGAGVKLFVLQNYLAGAEIAGCVLSRSFSQTIADFWVAQYGEATVGHGLDIP